MSLAEVAAVTGGRLHRATGAERVTAVEFDSRAVGPGGLFLALPGERADGHDFAAAAVAAGAVAVLAAREVDAPAVIVPPAPEPASVATGSYLAATDPDGSGAAVLAALARLAAHNVGCPAGPHGRRGHRQLRQDLDQGPARRRPRPARPDRRPARVVQQRAGAALDGAAGRRDHPPPRAGAVRARARDTSPRCAGSRSRGSGWCSTSGAPTSASSARRRRSPGEGRAGRGAARRPGSRCSTPTTRPSPRWRRAPGPGWSTVGRSPEADVRADDVVLDAGRARFRLVDAAGHGGRGAAAGRRAPRRQRPGRRRGRPRVRGHARGRRRRAVGRGARVALADGGHGPRRTASR